MKKLNIILGSAFALLALASCDRKADYYTVDFVSFPESAIEVQEDTTQFLIPIYAKSQTGSAVSTNVTFSVVDGTAKNGVDFTVEPANGVLNVNGEDASIVVKVVNKSGEYTGNQKFTIVLEDADNGYTLGAARTVSVTIKDLDHPLADVLGTYKLSCEDYANGPLSFYTSITPDENDVSVVWIDHIIPMGVAHSFDAGVYGIVSGDEGARVITVPLGQEFRGDPGILITWSQNPDGRFSLGDSGNAVLTQGADGVYTIDISLGYYDGSIYGYGLQKPGATLTKN